MSTCIRQNGEYHGGNYPSGAKLGRAFFLVGDFHRGQFSGGWISYGEQVFGGYFSRVEGKIPAENLQGEILGVNLPITEYFGHDEQ